MNALNLPIWMLPAFLLVLLALIGVAEYVHLAPAGAFYTVFLLVVGILIPSPVAPRVATPTPQEGGHPQ